MVEDSVYIYNRDIEELEKQLEEINRKMEKKINI